MNDPQRLIEICAGLIKRPDLQPSADGTVTHCNQFVDEALTIWLGASPIGKEFHGLMANAIVQKLEKDSAWKAFEVDDIGGEHHDYIEKGYPAIAGEQESGHGHVNLCIIGRPVIAGHWNCPVPLCANVGKRNFISEGLNFAFIKKPKIYVLIG